MEADLENTYFELVVPLRKGVDGLVDLDEAQEILVVQVLGNLKHQVLLVQHTAGVPQRRVIFTINGAAKECFN